MKKPYIGYKADIQKRYTLGIPIANEKTLYWI